MATHEEIIDRFAAVAGTPGGRLLRSARSRVFADGNTLYSYGRHFPLAVLMPQGNGPRGWWLANGDRSSVSTARHQNMTRSALKKTGLPVVTVPFSALQRAGIDRSRITPVQVLPDRTQTVTVRQQEPPPSWYSASTRLTPEGLWEYERPVHHLGEALLQAHYTAGSAGPDGRYRTESGDAYFLSAFDENEPGFGLYFLAQLPAGVHPLTVADAREALKPPQVKAAEALGLDVLRQGDVFAVPSGLKTRQLPGPSARGKGALGTNHVPTEQRTDGGTIYARGVLRHRPWPRDPDHRPLKLGDGKTWYALYGNTVPEGRSWSMGGNVD